jgi:hypothetical protein
VEDLLGGAAITAFLPAKKAEAAESPGEGNVLGVETEHISETDSKHSLIPVPVSPGFGAGGAGASTQTTSALSAGATSTSETSTTTAVLPILFTATTTAPVLTVSGCSYVLAYAPEVCVLSVPTTTVSWTNVDCAVRYELFINSAVATSTTATSTPFVFNEYATTTILVTAFDANSISTTSAQQQIFVLVPVVAPDITAPTVLFYTPSGPDKNPIIDVPIDSVLTITFSEPLATSSISTVGITLWTRVALFPELPDLLIHTTVPISVNLSTDGTVVTVVPTGGLQYGQLYYYKVYGGVSGVVTDIAGNAPAENILDSNSSGVDHTFTVIAEPAPVI